MIGLIWAQSANGIIGLNNAIPWRLPEDQANFKALTLGKTVVMGRLTWDSLPAKRRPLPGRRNVVLTRDRDLTFAGAEIVHTIEAALNNAETDIWVMGGSQIYAAALPYADQLVVTELASTVAGDAYAPVIDSLWHKHSVEPDSGWLRSSSGLEYRITTYLR